jgi:hypothetical protein
LATTLALCTSAVVVITIRALRPMPAPVALAASQSSVPMDIVAVLRAMQLVTVQIDAGVRSTSADASWRGDVLASVIAPARYYYAIDLSGLKPGDLSTDPLTGSMSLVVPAPRRLAVEVYPEKRTDSVRVSGTRLRDVAGEYHLGLARMGLYDQALRATLLDADQRRLEEVSARQLGLLVQALTGKRSPVRVSFAPSPAPTLSTAPEP